MPQTTRLFLKVASSVQVLNVPKRRGSEETEKYFTPKLSGRKNHTAILFHIAFSYLLTIPKYVLQKKRKRKERQGNKQIKKGMDERKSRKE
jgi:hypothetical protein